MALNTPSNEMPGNDAAPERSAARSWFNWRPWWPAWGILILGIVLLGVVGFGSYRSQQHRYIDLAKVLVTCLAAMLVWLLGFSPLRPRLRLWLSAGFLAMLLLFAAMFRVRGVTGNLVPILEPRWAQRDLGVPTETAPALTADVVLGAADFPQFLGPGRDGRVPGPRLATDWTSQPPRLLWRRPVGAGWSGFAVSGRYAVTQEQRDGKEFVVCYDLESGKPRWSHAEEARYFTTLAGEGPRATPSIRAGRVFAQGATGILCCLELNTGRLLWTKDILKDNQSEVPSWGHSSSPWVDDEVVIVSAGGRQDRSLVAYRVGDGAFVWGGGTHGTSYSSPAPAVLGGLRQIMLFTDAVVGLDAATGRPLWEFPWPGGHPHVAVPVVVDGSDLIVSSGYGTGSGRIRVQRDQTGSWTATSVWKTHRLKAKFTNLVLHQSSVYGLDDGILACLDAATGEFKWKDGKYGHGQVLLVGDVLLVGAENGDVVLVDPNPEGLRELARFAALRSKTWNPPALAGGYLLVRNDKEAACFQLPTAR